MASAKKTTTRSKQSIKKNSKLRLRFKKGKNLLWIMLGFLFLGGLYLVFTINPLPQTKIRKLSRIPTATPTLRANPTVTPSPTPEAESPLSSGKIAYTKDGNVYLLEPSGKKQLTSNGNIAYIKWSRDGKYLGWINRKTYPQKGANNYTWNYYAGISLTLLNMKTNEQTTIKSIPVPGTVNGTQGIQGFDFSNDDTQIAYINQGLWLMNRNTGEDKKLSDNIIDSKDPTENEIDIDVSWNPNLNFLLVRKHGWDVIESEIDNLNTNEKNIVSYNYGSFWSNDGSKIITYQLGGQVQGGLWTINTASLEKHQLLGPSQQQTWENEATVNSVAESKNGTIIATVNTYTDDSQNKTTLPFSGYNIYTISPEGQLNPLTKINKKDNMQQTSLNWSPNSKYITYLLDVNRAFERGDADNGTYNLHIMNSDGNNDRALLNNINTYAWYPLE